jgi:RNA polymerase-interacting CarD/CdnL/TRCF family regulator
MTEETQAYSPGDWIVHRHHGVGQIKGTEVMHIEGRKNTYCRIQTRDSTIWIPTEKLNGDWLRPLASPAEIQLALEVIRSPPHAMDADPTKRKSRINNVKPNHSPVVIAEILRDLWAHNKEKKQVSQSDVEALRHLTDLFLSEWSVCMDLEMGVIKQQLNDMLAQAGGPLLDG